MVSVSYLTTAEAPAVVPAAAKQAPAGAGGAAPSGSGAGGSGAGGGLRFGDVLSALNPLQYLPVVGTIYRAVTGDTIPEGLRIAGSFAVSALTGGPFGLLFNAAVTAGEKLTGIDPEAIARTVAADLGLGPAAPVTAPATAIAAAAPTAAAPGRPASGVVEAGTPASAVASASSAVLAMAGLDLPRALPRPDAPVPSDARRRAGLASYARWAVA